MENFFKEHLPNLKIKTLLAVPIKDQHDKIIGVCELLNKTQNKKFTPDDEILISNLTHTTGVIIRNSMQYDQSMILQYKLR